MGRGGDIQLRVAVLNILTAMKKRQIDKLFPPEWSINGEEVDDDEAKMHTPLQLFLLYDALVVHGSSVSI